MDTLQSDYRDMLINVGEYVDENKKYLDAMKFKCKAIIKGKESEGITSSLGLWEALEKRELIGPRNTVFLKELLQTCMKGIMPPLRAIENYEVNMGIQAQQVQHPAHRQQFQQQQPHAPHPPQVVYLVQAGQPFHNFNGTQQGLKKEITFLSRNLGRDWKTFMRHLCITEATMENIMSEHRSVREQIVQCLLFWQDQEQENATKEVIVTALKTMERNDLVMDLEDGNY